MVGLAGTLGELGHFEEAVAAYAEALEIKPDLTHERNNMGAALAQLGRFEEAAACYWRALALDLHRFARIAPPHQL